MTEQAIKEESKKPYSEHDDYIRNRNKKLHYHKALMMRMERENRRQRLFLFLILVPLLSIMSALSLILIDKQKYMDKQSLQNDLKSIITNGGDLDAIKQAFVTQPPVNPLKLIYTSESSYYEAGAPLSTVLNDLRVSAY